MLKACGRPCFIVCISHGRSFALRVSFLGSQGVHDLPGLAAWHPADVSAWYSPRAGKSLINFGVSAGHIPVRMQ